jgi:Transposase domain (DUF772)
LLSALLLQVFYGIRSERQLMEQLDYNLLYRWFVGLSPDDPVWDPTTFTKNRERLQNGDVFTKFMIRLLNHSQVEPLLSDEHFSVDGTLIEAWASQKSFRPKDGSGDDDDGANFHGQKRRNDTHASTSDPDDFSSYPSIRSNSDASLVGTFHDPGTQWSQFSRYSAQCSRTLLAFLHAIQASAIGSDHQGISSGANSNGSGTVARGPRPCFAASASASSGESLPPAYPIN